MPAFISLPVLPFDLPDRARAAHQIMPQSEALAEVWDMNQAAAAMVAAGFVVDPDEDKDQTHHTEINKALAKFHDALTRYMRYFIDSRLKTLPAYGFSDDAYDTAYLQLILAGHDFNLADLKRRLRNSSDYTEVREAARQEDLALYELAVLLLADLQ